MAAPSQISYVSLSETTAERNQWGAKTIGAVFPAIGEPSAEPLLLQSSLYVRSAVRA